MPHIITVTSGKGGVGKTNISVNVALQLAKKGYRTCLFDADLGLANINILLGLYPEANLSDVVGGQKTLSDILIRDYQGIDIVPGGTGIAKLANLTPNQIEPILQEFSDLDVYDYVIFDTSAGAGGNVTAFCQAATQMLLIITPEPTSLTDAYALLKILSAQGFDKKVLVAVNQARHLQHAKIPYLSLSRTVEKNLPVPISAIGFILRDSHVTDAVKVQKPFLTLYPKAIATTCIQKITDRIISGKTLGESPIKMKTFWSNFLGLHAPPTDERPLSAVPHHPPETTATPPNPDPLLREMAQSLSVIATEITTIRKMMAKRDETHLVNNEKTAQPPPTPSPVLLDFEAFLLEKQNEGNP